MRKMKNSGIEWIGEIPEEWEVKRNKYSVSYIKGKNPNELNSEKKGTPYIGASDLDKKIEEEYSNYTMDIDLPQCEKEDILLLWDGARAGLVGTGHKGAISSTIVKIQTDDSIDNHFFYWYIKGFERYISNCVGGTTIPHMNRQYIEDIQMLSIPLTEQHLIATYLDRKCSEIDSIVRETEQTIEEYKKLKQSLITEVVTGKKRVAADGLSLSNEPRKMKNSGVEWIGEVPEEWEIRKIGNFFRLRDEKNYEPMENVTLLSLYTGIGVFPHGEQEERGNKAVTVEGYKKVYKNDIVVNIILAWMGAVGVSNYEGVTSPAYDVYIPNEKYIVPHFYHYFFRTEGFAGECFKYGRGIMLMRWRTYSDEFKQINIPLPPLPEQHLIATYLDTKCSEIDKLIADKQTLLQELDTFKKSLIYECVTGKRVVN
ncbi:MAG: restriction endonuclease subunit S [Paludibacteraceae bacterium]|nr:restriction endonuclease subunit S [Paludibacteraceae bacterium]